MVEKEEEDKRKIFDKEREFFLRWFKTVASGNLRSITALATLLVMQGRVSSIRSLLCELRDGDGHLAIHFAASHGFVEVCQWILEQVPECVNESDENGDTPLSLACKINNMDVIHYLVSKGGNVALESKGNSAIQVACAYSKLELIYYLIEHGADIHVGEGSAKGTCLICAIGNHRNDVAAFLLKQGVNVNGRDDRGFTALIYACVQTDATCIQLLLQNQADATVGIICLPDGSSPLHIVAESGHVSSVLPFLALPTISSLANRTTSGNGKKPIEYAIEEKHVEVVKLLLPYSEEYKSMTIDDVMSVKKTEEKKVEIKKMNKKEKKMCEEFRKEGVDAFSHKEFSSAIEFFSKAIQLDATDERLFCNRSAAYIKLQQYKEALEDAEQCILLSPEWAKAYYRKGMALFHLKDYVSAGAAFYRGCELSPTNSELSQMFKLTIEKGKEEYKKNGEEKD